MRLYLLAVPILLSASAAFAAPSAPPTQIEIPPEMTDPQTISRLLDMTGAMSKVLLDMPVGELEAIAQGRPVTSADRHRRVRDETHLSPQDLQRQIAQARPQIEAATQAFARALPQITRSLSEVARQLEAATANMPQPYDPR